MLIQTFPRYFHRNDLITVLERGKKADTSIDARESDRSNEQCVIDDR